MMREMISFDELKNINFISKEEGNKITAFSFDSGLSLYVVFDKNSRLIESIRINGKDIDVTKENLKQLNLLHSKETQHIEVTSSITIDELSGLNFVNKIEGDTITSFTFINGNTMYVTYSQSTGIISSIKVNGQNVEVTRENLDYIKKALGLGEDSNKKSFGL